MGALLINGGRVISQAVNKTGPGILKDKRYNKSRNGFQVGIHAELATILRASRGSTKGATIIIAGWTPGSNLVHSQPCYRCQELLKEYGIRRAIFHNQSGEPYVMEL